MTTLDGQKEDKITVHPSRSTARLIAISVASLGAGVVLGITALSGAATTTTTPSTTKPPAASTPAAPPAGGAYGSNENPTHESGESAAREAAENSGQFHRGGFGAGGSNESSAHEKTESPAREAQENANPGTRPSSPAAPASVGSV
jgi:hypothetical protein